MGNEVFNDMVSQRRILRQAAGAAGAPIAAGALIAPPGLLSARASASRGCSDPR
jgi:hypothetical protein